MNLVARAPSVGPGSEVEKQGGPQDIGSKEIFLKLLVAQMKNQNPLNPSDPTQMSSQLAQFNMVEQQTNTNKWLEQMAAGQGFAGGGGAGGGDASYLGKTVTVNQNSIAFNGQTESFDVRLNGNIAQAYVVIRDGGGAAVRTMTMGALNIGSYPVQWDGKNDLGITVDSGRYTIEVMAADSDGRDVPSVAQRSGVVEAVRFTDRGTEFMVGGVAASLQDITEIRL